ncbi:hypothetical protein MC885_021031 [Smutsia gigantea]|nr:hypothetical protein MC885_021031 [Smutsia gigantea]
MPAGNPRLQGGLGVPGSVRTALQSQQAFANPSSGQELVLWPRKNTQVLQEEEDSMRNSFATN